ncbi:hypothetical protein B0H12DRAFT_1155296 [Mycena haematopus]|nr:hypothetical protein B0H12DRAFT_1155296 [Mycena haematopus]
MQSSKTGGSPRTGPASTGPWSRGQRVTRMGSYMVSQVNWGSAWAVALPCACVGTMEH